MPATASLYMVELIVHEWSECLAWYRDMVGLPVQLLDTARQFALLGSDVGRIALKATVQQAGLSCVRLSILSDDLEAARHRILSRGGSAAAIEDDPVERFRSFRTIDPAGTPVQIFAWLDPPR